jgi:hypothetical protein
MRFSSSASSAPDDRSLPIWRSFTLPSYFRCDGNEARMERLNIIIYITHTHTHTNDGRGLTKRQYTHTHTKKNQSKIQNSILFDKYFVNQIFFIKERKAKKLKLEKNRQQA